MTEIGKLKKDIKGVKCKQIENEKCSSWIWRKLIFEKKGCIREKCPGFIGIGKGETIRGVTLWSIINIIFRQFPAIATLVLMILDIF